MAYIYLLESIDEKHRYLGSTPDPVLRLKEHNTGKFLIAVPLSKI